MSVFSGPNAVIDGLVFAVDAANSKSYSGSGTAWNDLSGNVNDITLTNGPTYTSSDGGYLTFDGTDDYANFFAPNLGSTASVEVLCKIKSLTRNMLFGWGKYDLFCSGSVMGYNTASSDVYGLTSTQTSDLGLLNNWKHYVFEMRSDVSYTNNKIYVNGVSQSLSQVLGTESAANRNFNSGLGRISTWRFGTQYLMSMDLALFKVYNRSLTESEVKQNFNATKTRFGL